MLTLGACEKIWLEDNPVNSPIEIYESLWTELNDNYVFFHSKNVNWVEVHDKYISKLQPEINDEELFEVLSQLLAELKDGHVSLFSGFNTWLYTSFYNDHPSNFNQNFVEQQYLKHSNRIGPFLYSKIEEDIGYIFYPSFGENFTKEELEYLLEYNKNTKGLIIDVRDNVGGAADNVNMLISAFINKEQHFGTLHSPSIESADLNDVQKIIIKPFESNNRYSKPIALLTNRKCFSSCNLFAGFMSVLPNVSIIGDTTGGGAGLAVASDLANGWRFRYSAAKITLADGTELEEGVSPDYFVHTGPDEEQMGEDGIIEKAIELLE